VQCAAYPEADLLQLLEHLVEKAGVNVVSGCRTLLRFDCVYF
jgi:hypothetical protein